MTALTEDELRAAFCWEADDLISSRPAMTAFRREARYNQALWRDANRHPIGTQPIASKPGDRGARPVGSRLPLDYARDTGANFLTSGALRAARARIAYIEPRQSLDHQRLWADLLSSTALTFNLFGDLAVDLALADRAVHDWLPGAPGRVCEVRFAHSPGWFDPAYLHSLRSFATLFILDLDDGSRGLVAVDVKYHERNKPETPRPDNLTRYREVAERSAVFAPGAIDTLSQRGDLCVMWIEHLLMFSMLQHPSDNWKWGRYIVVHPAGNSDVVDLCARYRAMLADDSYLVTMTLETLLDTGTLPRPTITALRDRYVLAPPK
jgi:hypothetical protein